MGEVIELASRRQSKPLTLASITDQPERGPEVPRTQSGQPAFLFFMPDGVGTIRTTVTGFRAIELALQESALSGTVELDRVPAPEERVVNAVVHGLTESDFNRFQEELSAWVVLHSYGSRNLPAGESFERSFFRVGPTPPPSPLVRYLWLVDFGDHGGAWLFGHHRDVTIAHASLSESSFVVLKRESMSFNSELRLDELTGPVSP